MECSSFRQNLPAILEPLETRAHRKIFLFTYREHRLGRRVAIQSRRHKGFVVEGDPSMTIEEAARRRDFTVNAISWDPLTDEYFDPSNGRADLEKKLLRVVDPVTFGDDSLRVLRAVQFAARFEMTLDEQTKALCRAIPSTICRPNASGEMENCCAARRPRLASRSRSQLGVVDRVPGIEGLVCLRAGSNGIPKVIFGATLQVIDQAQRIDDLVAPIS